MILPSTCRVQYHFFININVDAADHVDERHKGTKIHLNIIMNWHANKLGDGFHRQTWSATR